MPEELIVLGTGAAEGIPALFCECQLCRHAQTRRGKDLRMRASYQFGDHLRVDWPPDALAQMHRYRLDYSKLQHLLITHSHYDHFFPGDLDMRRPGFSVVNTPFHLYGNQATLRLARRALKRWRPHKLTMHLIGPGDHRDLAGYRVLALPASHAPRESAMNFLVERDGFSVLIGTDTGWWSERVWRLLEGKRLDVVLMDCTYAARDSREQHLGAAAVIELRQLMLARALIDQSSRFFATHFSHNGGMLHHQLEELLNPQSVHVAYDGLRIALQR